MVALKIAQEKAPHTNAEKLILPCCMDIVRCLIGDDGEKKISFVPLSNHRRRTRGGWGAQAPPTLQLGGARGALEGNA